jgi:hypothetical protein
MTPVEAPMWHLLRVAHQHAADVNTHYFRNASAGICGPQQVVTNEDNHRDYQPEVSVILLKQLCWLFNCRNTPCHGAAPEAVTHATESAACTRPAMHAEQTPPQPKLPASTTCCLHRAPTRSARPPYDDTTQQLASFTVAAHAFSLGLSLHGKPPGHMACMCCRAAVSCRCHHPQGSSPAGTTQHGSKPCEEAETGGEVATLS